MKVALWISGKQNAQAVIAWATENNHVPVCLMSMEPKFPLPWATGNIDALKKVSDSAKIDLLFKTVKSTGDENFNALDTLLSYAQKKYGAEAVIVSPEPAIAHPIRNSAKKFKMKTILLK